MVRLKLSPVGMLAVALPLCGGALLAAPLGHALSATPGRPAPTRALARLCDGDAADGDDAGSALDARDGILYDRVSRVVKQRQEGDESDGLPALDAELSEAVSKEIDAAISARRRRVNARLGKSLKRFREEVLDEVELQADEVRARQARLRDKQQLVMDSLGEMREDILQDIEAALRGVRQGGERVERGLKALRGAWEDEVNELVADARRDVECAVSDVEEAINEQREDWKRSVALFEQQWLGQVRVVVAAVVVGYMRCVWGVGCVVVSA